MSTSDRCVLVVALLLFQIVGIQVHVLSIIEVNGTAVYTAFGAYPKGTISTLLDTLSPDEMVIS
eukprot:SAG31_NODE_1266_length_9065_cov_44.433939_7_plen_64_part_00